MMHPRPLGQACLVFLVLSFSAPLAAQSAGPPRATVTILTEHPLATFDPRKVWGAALDGQPEGEVAQVYTPDNVAAMNSAGFGPVSYRLRTELAIEAWHWNPAGRWSDSVGQQGYWTSSDRSDTPITVSYGYRLPRRGSTLDDGNNDGYSRIDDGDADSFWKSNPYLDPGLTGLSKAEHPQWLVVDLGKARPVDALRLLWGAPYARHCLVAYWKGDQSERIDDNPEGRWLPFPSGQIQTDSGGEWVGNLGPRPVVTRFVRLTLLESSHTAPEPSSDPRDRAGFALREIGLGTLDDAGRFHDAVRHGRTVATQSRIIASSTDPWHRAADRDPDVEQPGLDLLFQSGLTHDLPALITAGVLFDTPENAAALLRFIRARGFPVPRLELGEEPDGQRTTPEDYAALYLRFAGALRAVDSNVVLGGPSWQDARTEPLTFWPERDGPHRSWLGRFLDYLDAHGGRRDFGFFSFEWYPFDDVCTATGPQLARAPMMLASALDSLRLDGLPDSIPRIMTEYGYSAFSGPAEVELSAALLNAEAVAGFFSHGGSEAYVYGLEPGELLREPGCRRWGNNLLFLGDSERRVQFRLPAYYAARLLTHSWADSGGGVHTLFPTEVRLAGRQDRAGLLSAYALHRPDGRWAVLLINRDPRQGWTIETSRQTASGIAEPFRGPLEVWQYSSAQYRWREHGDRGHPDRSEPPAHWIDTSGTGQVEVSPYSVTVILSGAVSLGHQAAGNCDCRDRTTAYHAEKSPRPSVRPRSDPQPTGGMTHGREPCPTGRAPR